MTSVTFDLSVQSSSATIDPRDSFSLVCKRDQVLIMHFLHGCHSTIGCCVKLKGVYELLDYSFSPFRSVCISGHPGMALVASQHKRRAEQFV